MTSTIANKSLRFRAGSSRGHSLHSWLDSYHSFSFASYFDPKFSSFGPLRVINEDVVKPSEGFGTHPHSKFEIWSYVVSGELRHKDSIGNLEVIRRGDVQFTSAGTGIAHSEYNHSNQKPVHFLQIWASPNTISKPEYQTGHFTDEVKRNKLCPIVVPTSTTENKQTQTHQQLSEATPLKIRQDLYMYASLLGKEKSVTHSFSKTRSGYIQVVSTKTGGKVSVSANTGEKFELAEGDSLFLDANQKDDVTFTITGLSEKETEFLLFDLFVDPKEQKEEFAFDSDDE